MGIRAGKFQAGILLERINVYSLVNRVAHVSTFAYFFRKKYNF